jgi:diketogulonate reductase-like aldo/keto reductase
MQALADGLRSAVDSGKAKAVGVCNYNKAQLEELHGLLDKHGVPIASNQVRARRTLSCEACLNLFKEAVKLTVHQVPER